MTGSSLLAATLAALAAATWSGGRRIPATRLAAVAAQRGTGPAAWPVHRGPGLPLSASDAAPGPDGRRRAARPGGAEAAAAEVATRARRHNRTRAAAAIAGVAVVVLLGGVTGLLLGAVTAVLGPVLLGRLQPRDDRERARQVRSQAPEVADLMAACLAAGAPLSAAAAAVARAMRAPVDEPLARLVATLDLGADPVQAWRDLGREPGLADLARAVARSVDSGAPLGDVLPGVADDLRRATRAEAEAAARAAGVKAVAPLGACFLPAFLLLGVVPVVAALATGLLTG